MDEDSAHVGICRQRQPASEPVLKSRQVLQVRQVCQAGEIAREPIMGLQLVTAMMHVGAIPVGVKNQRLEACW